MLLEFSFDDGVEEDKKVIEILNKYGQIATFYIPILSWGFKNIETYDNQLIGAHTVTHPQDLKLLSEDILFKEIGYSKYLLEKETDKTVQSFCPPRGRYNKEVVEMCKWFDFVEVRTTRVLSKKESDHIVKNTTVHMYQRKEYKNDDIFTTVEKYSNGDYFHLWGHAWEIEKYDLWDVFEESVKYLSTKVYERFNSLGK